MVTIITLDTVPILLILERIYFTQKYAAFLLRKCSLLPWVLQKLKKKRFIVRGQEFEDWAINSQS